MTRFFLSCKPENLNTAISQFARTATVEAEYGNSVVEGSVLTLAHHGPRSGNPAPCLAENGVTENIEAVGLSHIDLDSLGGCAAIIGRKPEATGFWNLAAFVDVNGPHKLGQSEASDEDVRRLYAYWAWSEEHEVFSPRDGSVLEVTDQVTESLTALEKILAGDEQMLVAGDVFKKGDEELNKLSFVEELNGVIVRVCGGFSNHLYITPDGKVCRAVVALRTDSHSCTVSFADPIEGASCLDIAQIVWADKDETGKFLAGGHEKIAGGPRGKYCGLDTLVNLRDVTVAAITK